MWTSTWVTLRTGEGTSHSVAKQLREQLHPVTLEQRPVIAHRHGPVNLPQRELRNPRNAEKIAVGAFAGANLRVDERGASRVRASARSNDDCGLASEHSRQR